MSLKMRLSLICAFFSVAICLLSYVGYSGSKSLATSLNLVAKTQMPAVHNMTLLDMVHDGLRAVVYRSIYYSGQSGAGDQKKEIAAELEEMSKDADLYISKLSTMRLAPDTLAAIGEATPTMKRYVELANRITRLALENKKDQAVALLPEFQTLFAALAEQLENLGRRIDRDASHIDAQGQGTPTQILWISIVAIALGILVSILAVVSLSRTLFRAYNQINQVSGDVNQTGLELSSASQQLASASQEQASSIEETSSSLEEISGMVASALKSSEQSVVLSNKVSELVKSGSDSMSQLQEAVHQIAEANTRVEKLAKLIEEIGEKTELIDEIVFQTRLLSFNASVEAERAGEHGRGFAVVAQEVGNLAQMSGKSASEITQIVKSSIKEAQEVVQLNRAKVDLGVNLCKKTYLQLQSIETASKEILGSAENVLRSSEEQNSGIQQINQAIQLVSQTTQENTALAVEVSGNSMRLTSQSEKMKVVVGHIEAMVFGLRRKAQDNSMSQATVDSPSAPRQAAKPAQVHDLKSKAAAPSYSGNLALKDQEDPWEKL